MDTVQKGFWRTGTKMIMGPWAAACSTSFGWLWILTHLSCCWKSVVVKCRDFCVRSLYVCRALTLALVDKLETLSMAFLRREDVTVATAAIRAAENWDSFLALPGFCSITSGKFLKTVISFGSLGFWMPSSNNLGSDFHRCFGTAVLIDPDWFLGLGTSGIWGLSGSPDVLWALSKNFVMILQWLSSLYKTNRDCDICQTQVSQHET